VIDPFSVATAVITEDPLDRRRPGTLELLKAALALYERYRYVGPDLVKPVEIPGKYFFRSAVSQFEQQIPLMHDLPLFP
jgi:hypothetical protein